MGPGRAADIIREGLPSPACADNGYLLTDQAYAGVDTLAILARFQPSRKIGIYDIIIGGRRAIDEMLRTR